MSDTPAIAKRNIPPWLWPDWKRRVKMLRWQSWVYVTLVALALAVAYLLPTNYRNTSTAYVYLAWSSQLVRTGQYHLGALAAIIAICALIGRSRKLAIAAAVVAIFTLAPLAPRYLPHHSATPAEKPLRVFSANLLMINQYTDGILGEIDAADPDIIMLQEYTDHWHAAAMARLANRYPHRAYVTQDDSFGIAIFSKTPFVGTPKNNVHLGEWPLPQMRAVVEHRGRQIVLYNIHLLPPRTFEYTLQHRLEFADLLDHLKKETAPVILTGDFNCTEATTQAADIRRLGMTDSQEQAGYGRGATWPVNGFLRYLPSIRLDHIYLSPQLAAVSCRTGTGQGSDHRPLIADIVFK